MPRPHTLRADHVRRMVLAAQGLADPRPTGRVDRRHLRRVVQRLGLVQIDSVNVLERAHHLPFFSRLGPHDQRLLHRMAYDDHELFEYWGHVASLIDVELEPLLRWRMADPHQYRSLRRFAVEQADLVDALEREVHQHGPVSAGDLDEGGTRAGPWWGWGDTKVALECLFAAGRVGALRRDNFERVYCHPDDAVPPSVRARPTPDRDDAQRELLVVAARAHGVGTAKDLADYWRLKVTETKPLLQDLVDDGRLESVEVEGWTEPAYAHPAAVLPRAVDAASLVSPFDVAMWERDRIERVHDFHYRIEIYVPEPQRQYGYYVLPFLLGDTFVGRVDLKADRRDRRLLVPAAHVEHEVTERGHTVDEVATRLAVELDTVARWLDLDEVVVGERGNLAPALSRSARA